MRKYLLIAVVTFALVMYLYAIVFDTSISRRLYAQKIRGLVASAKNTEDPALIVRRLIDETNSPLSFVRYTLPDHLVI